MNNLIKVCAVGSVALLVTACGGFDEQACYESAKALVEKEGGEIHTIVGRNWQFIGEMEDGSIKFIETMNLSNCDVTMDYQVN